MKRSLWLLAVFSLELLAVPSRAQYMGQGNQYAVSNTAFGGRRVQQNVSTMQNLEQALDVVDSSSAWSRTPVSGAPPRQQQQQQQQQQQPYSLGNSAQMPSGAMMPRVTKRDLARVFFEGGSVFDGVSAPQAASFAPPPSGTNSQATATAYQGYQRAQNMATRARNAAYRARNDADQWVRKKAADEAYYDANDADAAANRAYYAAQNGDAQARGYANLARQAADRARADANRARYNADTTR